MNPRCLMVQGTTSEAGKSTLVTGLCRVLRRRGVRVAPFKPQNMALNSAVAADGGEIGRAQALQAQAAGVAPSTDMNPVLLKPASDTAAQVIVDGRVVGNMEAGQYQAFKRHARASVLAAFARLAATYDAVIVEGAGSPAEVNLRADDIANMGFAEAVDSAVVLIADIDRGGVFAHVAGTLALLAGSERRRVTGFVINRFRGERLLLDPGLHWLEGHTGKPVFGVLPYLTGLALDSEDAIVRQLPAAAGSPVLRVVVPVLPRISNHTDFEPLRAHPQVQLHLAGPGEAPPPSDVVILPGSKNVRADLAWLRAGGWEHYLQRHLRYGGRILGICGGFQMLGRRLCDPSGLEGPAGESAGFGWLDFETILQPQKTLRNVTGRLAFAHTAVRGYEIHAGLSSGPALQSPALVLDDGGADGALSPDGQILGTYLHGLLDDAAVCAALLCWMGLNRPQPFDHAAQREQSIERLADALECHLNLTMLLAPLAATT